MLAAGRAGNLMLLDEILHLFLAPAVYTAFDGNTVLLTEILDQLIRTETLMTFLTIHQRIRETAQMSAGYPCLGIHQDRTVHTYIIGALLNKLLPPCLFHIVLQLYAKVTVIPGICQASVNLGTGIYKTSCFRQGYDLLHCFFHVSTKPFLLYICIAV